MLKSSRILSLAVVAAASLTASQVAKATMVVDLRFDGQTGAGIKTQTFVPNTNYTIDVWATVSGGTSNTTPSNEGFGTLIGSMQSSQLGAGAASGGMVGGAGVGITTQFAVQNANFKDTSPDGALGVLDSAVASNDSIGDIGLGTTTSTASEIKVIANIGTPGSVGVFVNSAGVTANQINNDSTEFFLGSVTFHTGAINPNADGTSATALNWVSFAATAATKTSIQWIDGVKVSTLNAQSVLALDSATANNGVLFITAPIPEPASLGVLALGGLSLLARRRKHA